jgi:hypothetical protein
MVILIAVKFEWEGIWKLGYVFNFSITVWVRTFKTKEGKGEGEWWLGKFEEGNT